MLSRRSFNAAFASALLASTSALPARANETIRVRLDWTPWGDQAPIHFAAQKGVFKKHGLDVTVDDGNGSVATVQIVGNGEYDVGHASLAPMAIARSKGLPVTAIAGFVQKNDIGLLVPVDSGIKSPGDLKGKKIAFTAGSLEAPFIDSFLAAGKLKRGDVELLNVNAAAKVGTYISGQADGVFSSVPFFLPIVSVKRPSTSVNFADYGLNFPSFGLFATEQTIKAKHDAVKKFATIVSGCWAHIANGHIDEGVQAIIAARPQAKLDPAILHKQIENLIAFQHTKASAGMPFGFMADADWKEAIDVLKAGGLLDKPVEPSGVFTNALLDKAMIEDMKNGKF
jgi:NitT/TauT family transport system substrate-binding protein